MLDTSAPVPNVELLEIIWLSLIETIEPVTVLITVFPVVVLVVLHSIVKVSPT